MKESINLNQAEVAIINYALEELLNSDDLAFGPSTEQLSDLLTKFENLANKLKQNKFTSSQA